MGDDVSALNLDDDLEEVLTTTDAARWTIQRAAPLEVWATLSPAGHSRETYQARLLWSIYPDEPPSLKFRDPVTGSLTQSSAWPRLPGLRPGSLDACVNWTAEGLALHPEWRRDARYRWDGHGNALLKVLRILQEQLDDPSLYQGRSQ